MYAQQDQHQQDSKPQKQEQQAKPEKQQQAAEPAKQASISSRPSQTTSSTSNSRPRASRTATGQAASSNRNSSNRPRPNQQQQQQAKGQQEQQQKQQQQAKAANQHQQQQAKGQQEQQQKQQHAAASSKTRIGSSNSNINSRPIGLHSNIAHPAEQQAVWQGHRAQNWQSEHRDWQQRGGYHGYRIPEDRYRGHFGRDHWFRIYSYPVVVVGGYPRFQYDGFWFSIIDPWPESWSDDWYDNDDVYIDYSGGGYYLYNRRYPGDRIAVEVYLN